MPLFSKTKVLLDFFQKIAVSKGSEATEVWVPAQTSGAQAPFFGGLLGPTVRSAASAAMPPQFALRARGHRAHVVLDSRPKQHPSLLGLLARSAFHATLGQDAPCGLGVSAPSPQAPPQWGKVRFLPVLYPKVSSTFSKVAGSRGSEATEVWVPAQTSGAQAPFFGGLLGLSARSALRATPPQFALRARGR